MAEIKPKTQPLTVTPETDAGVNRRRFDSRQLFMSQTEVVIDHQGEEYRLRITSNNKLILTK